MSYSIKNPKNDFINGNLDIWQRGTSFVSPATGTYTADRIRYFKSGSMVHTITQDSSIPATFDYNYSMKFDVTTAQVSIGAGDFVGFQQRIEGFNFKKYVGQWATVGFWVQDAVTGVHSISFTNTGNDRSYVTEYTINVANTPEYKTVKVLFSGIPGGGTWSYINGVGIAINFMLACGTTFQTSSVNTWLSGNYLASNNQVNSVNNIANNFYIWGVSFNVGNQVYSNFNYDYETELTRCQRYYETTVYEWLGLTTGAFTYGNSVEYKVTKRILPTVTQTSVAASGFSATPGKVNETVNGYTDTRVASGAGANNFRTTATIDAEL